MRRALSPALTLLAVAALLMAITAATARPGNRALYPPKPCAPHVTVFLTHNGYHAELAFPAALLRSRARATAKALNSLGPSPWVSIGWGDARFYRQAGWSAERVRDGLRTLWPDNPSVIRLIPLNRAPDLASQHRILPIELSDPGAERLLHRLDHAFRIVGGRPVQVPALQVGEDAAYFESTERFSVAKTCNEWIGQLLNASGLATTPMLDVAPQGLMWEIRGQAAGQSRCRAVPGPADGRSGA